MRVARRTELKLAVLKLSELQVGLAELKRAGLNSCSFVWLRVKELVTCHLNEHVKPHI